MKSNDTPRLGRRRTVMKMEPARPEPSCGTTEASVGHFSGSSAVLGRLEVPGKFVRWSWRIWQMRAEAWNKYSAGLDGTFDMLIFFVSFAGLLFLSCLIWICLSVRSVHLYYLFPSLEEGGLATYRTAIVQNQHLAMLAKVNSPPPTHNKSFLCRPNQCKVYELTGEHVWDSVIVSCLPVMTLLLSKRAQGKRVILSCCHPFPFHPPPIRFVIGVKRLLFWRTRLVQLGSPWAPRGLPETLSSSCYRWAPLLSSFSLSRWQRCRAKTHSLARL